MGKWGRNIALETLHVLVGYVSKAQTARALKCMLSHQLKLDMFWWVVGFKVQVSRLMFCGARFSTGQYEYWAATKTRHVSVLVCSRACAGCAWKPAPSCLKVSYAFTTCC
jgi:hypothetical protein